VRFSKGTLRLATWAAFSTCLPLTACRWHRKRNGPSPQIVSAPSAEPSSAPKELERSYADGHSTRQGLPEGWGNLSTARVVEIYDEWKGLGPAHAAFLRLQRAGVDEFLVEAKVKNQGVVAERVPDPFLPLAKSPRSPCLCPVQDDCVCERSRDEEPERAGRFSRSVTATRVESFLSLLSTYGLDPLGEQRNQALQRMRWTDDYPKAHVAIWLEPKGEPIHLSFLDQHRFWRVNGSFLSPDQNPFSSSPDAAREQGHPRLRAAYEELLKAIGLDQWLKQIRKRESGELCPVHDPLCEK
jgi:hypothetical protein